VSYTRLATAVVFEKVVSPTRCGTLAVVSASGNVGVAPYHLHESGRVQRTALIKTVLKQQMQALCVVRAGVFPSSLDLTSLVTCASIVSACFPGGNRGAARHIVVRWAALTVLLLQTIGAIIDSS
jgi:hypothetical protein